MEEPVESHLQVDSKPSLSTCMPGQISQFLTNITETLLTNFVSKGLKKSAASTANTELRWWRKHDLLDGNETHGNNDFKGCLGSDVLWV